MIQRLLALVGLLPPDAPTWHRRLAIGALLFVIALWLVTLGFMSTVPFAGDERFYTRNAAAIADLVFRGKGSLEGVGHGLVAHGWFMPGLSLLLAPVYAIDATASVAVVRAYTTLLNFLLWLWAMREVTATFHRNAAAILLIFPTLALTWMMFSATSLADLPAGLLLAVIIARAYRIASQITSGHWPSATALLVLELLLVALVYLRGSFLPIVGAIHVILIVVSLTSRSKSHFVPRAALLVLGLTVFALLLAPWSVAASYSLGGTVVTTSTAPLSFGVTFGPDEDLCFGRCPGPQDVSIWRRALRYSRSYGQEHGISQLEAQRRMAAYAVRDLDVESYLRQVRSNFNSFLLKPSRLVERFVTGTSLGFSQSAAATVKGLVETLTLAVYLPFLGLLAGANMVIMFRNREDQVLSLLLKVATLCLFLQPFVHPSNGRYWSGFAPLMGVAGILFLGMWESVRPSARETDDLSSRGNSMTVAAESNGGSRILTSVQTVYVLGIIGFALILAIV